MKNAFEKILKKAEKEAIKRLNFSDKELIQENEQGSDQWFEDRRGRFTGSQISELMKCGKATAKMPWGTPEKILDLGEGALAYIYSKAMERKTNKILKIRPSVDMKYGKIAEYYVIKEFLKSHSGLKHKKCGFIKINDYLGASPDDYFLDKEKNKIGCEVKSLTSWSGLLKRNEHDFNEKHIDFWQIHTEMLSLKVKELIYIVSEPEMNTFEVSIESEDPTISKMYINTIQASEIHQQSILNRAKLGNDIIVHFLRENINFYKAVELACKEYNQLKF